jgi:hypothetical protein
MKYLGDLASKVKVRINNINIIFVYTIMPKLCDFETCRKQASYGDFYGQPIRCKLHKEETHKLVSKICQEGNCKVTPSYNYESETKAIFCYNHKLENMILVRGKFCIFQKCKCLPNYNYTNETKPLYCGKHKLQNMVNITSKRCLIENCDKFPSFNFLGQIIPLYCYEHKIENMIDIKHKKCAFENCIIRPNFNYKDEKNGLYCFEHKLENMIDVTHKLCLQNNCISRATCNYKDEKNGLYCFDHRLENMINITDKKCKAGFCLGTKANTKYKGYCCSCYQQLFPNDPLTFQIRSKTKEIAVRDFINTNFEGFHHDKPLWTGNCDCTHRRRIDHRKLIGNTLLCIETDENQHKSYDKKDEEIRYDDVFMLHGGKFIYIRFNPDKFKDKNGQSANPMLYTRLPVLKEEIEKQIKRIENDENSELLEIIKLYYNE